jgi:hypothetical protein
MKKLPILILLATVAFSQSDLKPIPAEHLSAFEQARADEMESAKIHDADLAKLRAAYAVVQSDCEAQNADAQRPDRGSPLRCVPKPAPAKSTEIK